MVLGSLACRAFPMHPMIGWQPPDWEHKRKEPKYTTIKKGESADSQEEGAAMFYTAPATLIARMLAGSLS